MIQFNASRSIRFDSERISMEKIREFFPQSECALSSNDKLSRYHFFKLEELWRQKKTKKIYSWSLLPAPILSFNCFENFLKFFGTIRRCFFLFFGVEVVLYDFAGCSCFLQGEQLIKKMSQTHLVSCNSLSPSPRDLETESFSEDEKPKVFQKPEKFPKIFFFDFYR